MRTMLAPAARARCRAMAPAWPVKSSAKPVMIGCETLALSAVGAAWCDARSAPVAGRALEAVDAVDAADADSPGTTADPARAIAGFTLGALAVALCALADELNARAVELAAARAAGAFEAPPDAAPAPPDVPPDANSGERGFSSRAWARLVRTPAGDPLACAIWAEMTHSRQSLGSRLIARRISAAAAGRLRALW